jgi:hypothetical protein
MDEAQASRLARVALPEFAQGNATTADDPLSPLVQAVRKWTICGSSGAAGAIRI